MKEVYYILKDITLDAAASNNSEILEEYDDMGANVTMSNLTLKKDGKLHALTLPFSTPIAGSPLEGATVYVITNVETVNKQLQLKFTPVTDQIEAGMPYFVKWTSGSDIVNPTFHKVYLKNQTMGIQDREYEFCGTYDMLVNEDDLKGYTYILDSVETEHAGDDSCLQRRRGRHSARGLQPQRSARRSRRQRYLYHQWKENRSLIINMENVSM